jgi:hypothetical protein
LCITHRLFVSIACQIDITLRGSAYILLLTKMKTQNTVGIVAAISILIAAVLVASSTIAFQNAHAVTTIATSGPATAKATASTTSGASASAIAGTCSAFASILGAIAGC